MALMASLRSLLLDDVDRLAHARAVVALDSRPPARRAAPGAGISSFSRSAQLRQELVLQSDDLPDLGMRQLERPLHLRLGYLKRAALDHHDGIVGAGDHEIQRALLELLERRVDHVLAVHEADAHRGDRDRRTATVDMASAALAPMTARMSGSFSPSAERTLT